MQCVLIFVNCVTFPKVCIHVFMFHFNYFSQLTQLTQIPEAIYCFIFVTHDTFTIQLYFFSLCNTNSPAPYHQYLATSPGIKNSTCKPNEIICVSDGRCIEGYKYCNGIVDCDDESDEFYCSGFYNKYYILLAVFIPSVYNTFLLIFLFQYLLRGRVTLL